jgi:hypothetical protein
VGEVRREGGRGERERMRHAWVIFCEVSNGSWEVDYERIRWYVCGWREDDSPTLTDPP